MPWRHTGEWRYSSTFLYLGTRWRWEVIFTPRPLYPRVKGHRYPLDRRLSWPQSRSTRCGEGINFLPYRGSNSDPSALQSIASRYTECAIPDPGIGRRLWTGLIWLRIGSPWWAIVNTVMNIQFHKGWVILFTSWVTISLLRWILLHEARCSIHVCLSVYPSRRVVTSTWWEGLVLPMIPRAMPVGA
jgi:hypothetical protein